MGVTSFGGEKKPTNESQELNPAVNFEKIKLKDLQNLVFPVA